MHTTRKLISLFTESLHLNVAESFKINSSITISGGGNFASKAFLLADILRKNKKGIFPVLWVVNDKTEQENTARSCEEWLGVKTLHFEMAENEHLNREITAGNRLQILRALKCFLNQEEVIIIAPFLNLIQETPSVDGLKKEIFTIRKGHETSQVAVFERLITLGYTVSKDRYLERGQYRGDGEMLTVFPVNEDNPLRIGFEFDKISEVLSFNQEDGEIIARPESFEVYPINIVFGRHDFLKFMKPGNLFIEDELEVYDEFYEEWDTLVKTKDEKVRTISYTAFPEDTNNHTNLHYLSVLKYQDPLDLVSDLREKSQTGWKVAYFTKNIATIEALLDEKKLQYLADLKPFANGGPFLRTLAVEKDAVLPHSFQNGDLKIAILSDRDIANLKEQGRSKTSQKVYWDFLTQLKSEDLVVHVNHGIARFEGLERRTVDDVTREYMKLCYAENDKLFVPIDQADKVNKFIGAAGEAPKLTRLGSAEWSTITKKVRRETEKIAKELLELYAKRRQAKAFAVSPDHALQLQFEKSFPYEETPGQLKAIIETKQDMEKPVPMDRLICGDVGFGKTEVALRAAFKAVQDKKQVALVSPITILADQHYRTFQKRMEPFHVRVEMLSRFRTAARQKEILGKLGRGEIDIIIGTHRLLQKDVKFKDLGLVIVDEEQRFGVKQKEQFKHMRNEVHILTLTATPIPRTLNICLNKLRDITTITTPPPGRLPVVTEVRRFSNELIREAILRELKRGGQIYFLHNRVQTIDGVAEKLKSLVPEARFEVAHGKLMSRELEQRIIDFKDHRFDVLVSSAIIENGIDLSNANTLIVNNAERFGLAQLYQLRGRVGRGKAQAYAYFLYHAQRLHLDAKKRLRAIVEASELGSGFQIAMKDLEIRGAGDILGVNQHGVINIVGVSHFIRMLNRAVEDLQAGKTVEKAEEEQEVAVELPLPAYIPDHYIVNSKEKINAYQRLAAADKTDYLEELKEDILQEFGKFPREVANLFRIIEMKIYAKQAGLTVIKAENVHMKTGKQVILYMGNRVKPENIVNLLNYNSHWLISGNKLRIHLQHLGMQWFDELRECIKKLAEKIEKPEMLNSANGNGARQETLPPARVHG